MFNPDCLVPIARLKSESRGILVNTLAFTASDWSNAARLFSYNAAPMNKVDYRKPAKAIGPALNM